MEVQNLINSCPLYPAIICSDLLHPKGLNRHLNNLNEGKTRSRYLYIQQLVYDCWRIWLGFFVPNLQVRSKWWKMKENLAIGDIILLINSNTSQVNGKSNRGISQKRRESAKCEDKDLIRNLLSSSHKDVIVTL